MKLLHFTDPRHASTAPRSRIDDYGQAMLDKVDHISNLCMTLDIDAAIVSGDICHTKNIALPYINQCVLAYRHFPCPVYGIIGNHDISYGRADTVSRTPLGTLIAAGAIDLEKYVCDELNTRLYFMNFIEKPWEHVPKITKEDGVMDVLVAHAYWDKDTPFGLDEETLKPEHVQDFDIVLLGHDHTPYPLTKAGRTIIVRPGSLSRGTQTGSAFDRDVFCAVIDTTAKTIQYHKIAVNPAEVIFNSRALQEAKATQRKDAKEFMKLMTAKAADNTVDTEKSLEKLVSELPEPDRVPVKTRTVEHLRSGGVL